MNSRAWTIVFASAAALLASFSTSSAQTTPALVTDTSQQQQPAATHLSFSRASITLEAANALIRAALAKAADSGLTDSVAVVDENGTLKAFERMEGSGFNTADLAQRKAYTSARVRAPTHMLKDRFLNDDSGLLSFALQPNVTFLGGGFPIVQENTVIGGVGVSGGTSAQDMDVAQAALAAVIP
jgi:uncharacterized protein GlcG (DUF336 family)